MTPRTVRPRRLPPVAWIEGQSLPTGSRQWFSRDGMLRVICSEGYGLPRLWQLWRWHHGTWRKTAEKRARQRIERLARQVAAAMEDAD